MRFFNMAKKYCNYRIKKKNYYFHLVYDASAKIPSSILKGNLNQFGDYDQCISIYTKIMKDQKKEKDLKITGKYCLASVDIEATAESTKLPVNLAQGRAFLRSRNKDVRKYQKFPSQNNRS